jgi:phage-related protein (TIGR01555 family)
METEIKQDGWSNFYSGLGDALADKQKHTVVKANGILPDDILENIFTDDGLGTNIIKAIPDDMFREGWEYSFSDPEVDELKAKKFEDEYSAALENIDAVSNIKKGFYWARLYGGAAIIIGAIDGQTLETPLNPKNVKDIEYLRVVDRSDIAFKDIKFQIDPMKRRYGLPELYPIKSTDQNNVQQKTMVHYSRVIELHGEPLPEGADKYPKETRYWGMSVLQNVIDYLKSVGSSMGDIAHLINEFSIGKLKLGDLAEILSAPDGRELVQKRVSIMDMTKSVFHSIYLDKGDDFVRENVNFGGIPQVLHVFFMMVSSCTGIPITRLFGVSPAGMNSTGESDMRNYYDKVRSRQTSDAAPVLLRLVRLIAQMKNLPEPYIVWKPLQLLSPKEQAEVDKLIAETEHVKAQTYQAYINAGIMEPYEARYLQFGDTLDKIPVPEENVLPPAETLPEGQPGAEEEGSEEQKRIEELEGKEKLSEEEQKELEELKKKQEDKK